MVVCNVVSYSGDEDVLISTKAAMPQSHQHPTGKRKSQRRRDLPPAPAAKKPCGVTKNSSITASATGNFYCLGFSQLLYYTLL